MSAPPRSRPWLRRLTIGLVVLASVLVLAAIAGWWSLPWIVRKGFLAGAKSLGSDEASIEVQRADLSGLRASAVKLRLGGLEVALAQGSTTYSFGRLFGGQVSSVQIEGLDLTLDFTRPRRGLLPDAIEDLITRFSTGGELVWPIDTLTLERSRLVLKLPEGTHAIAIAGTATRRPDGLIALELHASDRTQHLSIRGAIRTETLDGELTLDRMGLQPEVLLAIARQLGLFSLPDTASADISRIDLTGTVALKAGAPDAFRARLSIPSVRLTSDTTLVALDALTIEAAQLSGSSPTANLTTTLAAADTTLGWKVNPTALHIDLAGGKLRGRLDPAECVVGETASGRVGLTFEGGLPALGGPAHAQLGLSLADLKAAGMAFAPLELTLEGWTDQIALRIPRIALSSDAPAEVTEFAAVIHDPLADALSISGSAGFIASAELLSRLPTGWRMTGLSLPGQVARLEFDGKNGPGGIEATVGLLSTLPAVRLEHAETSIAGAPSFRLSVQANATGASIAGSLELRDVASTLPFAPSPIEVVSLTLEMPHTRYTALSALAEKRAPAEALALSVAAALKAPQGGVNLDLSLAHDPAIPGWRVRAEAAAHGVNGVVNGVTLTNGAGTLAVDSGIVNHTTATAWLSSGDMRSIAHALLPQVDLRLALNAEAIERAGTARLEWAGLSLNKIAALPEKPPLQVALQANAGILRTGPETIEQPSLAIDLTGDLDTQDITAKLQALIEGAPLVLETRQAIVFDAVSSTHLGTGDFTLQPFALAYSDIASRWMPELKGLVLSGTLAAEGTTSFASDGTWDGTVRIRLRDGVGNYPAQDVRAEGIFADVQVTSLAALSTAPGQRLGLSSLTVNDVVVSDALVRFRTDSPSVVHVEGAGFHVFDGVITAEPFSLYFPDADVALDLRMKDLDAGTLVRTFDLFNGTLTGRLQGRLPIGLLAGKPIIGEGFLELQPEHPAKLSLDVGGLFTSGLPNRTVLEQINRLPHELLEDGLTNLELRHFRIDLFRRDHPDRPIEIVLGGVAHTARAEVPIELTVHLHGSMSQVVDMLLQLLML